MARFLYDTLNRRAPERCRELDRLCAEALEIWREQSLRTFTEHGEPHIRQVEENLDALARPLQEELSNEEIFVLLAACWLHDIGMQLDVPDARREHAQHAYDLILRSFRDSDGRERSVQLSLLDPNAREAVAQVARGHWTSFALDLPETDYIVGNSKGRLRLLGVLLAMADLVDVSPVRARYFRTPHRLYELDALAELHQTMHQLVKGYELRAADPKVPGDLVWELAWRQDSRHLNTLADWLLHGLSAQWRQLRAVLHAESAGSIRWANPWARSILLRGHGQPLELSERAWHVLEAERLEQQRIGRHAFARAFREAMERPERRLFRIPESSLDDGSQLFNWSLAQARKRGLRTGRLELRQAKAPSLESLAAELLHQWGLPTGAGKPSAAMEKELKRSSQGFCTLIVDQAPLTPALLDQLLTMLLAAPATSASPRICLLVSPRRRLPRLRGVKAGERSLDRDLSLGEVVQHLEGSWGYPPGEADRLGQKIAVLGLLDLPGSLYSFVQLECVCWSHGSIGS